MNSKVILMVLSVIIAGMVVIFGFKTIISLSKQVSSAELSDFVLTLKNKLIGARSSYGDVEIIKLKAKGITKVCFAEEVKGDIDPLMKEAIESKTGNIFIYEGDQLRKTLLLKNLVVEGKFLCIKNKGGIELRAEGIKDNKVLVGEVK